jgi:hypothetical protein
LIEEQPGQPSVMPEESRKKMSLAVMCNEFKGLAKSANETEDGKKIIRMHLKAIKKELVSLKKETEKRAKRFGPTAPPSTAPPSTAPPSTTPPSTAPSSSANVQPEHHTQGVATECTSSDPRTRQPPKRRKTTTASSAPLNTTMPSNSTEAAGSNPNTSATIGTSSETSQVPIIRDPRRSNTKGRKRKNSFEHPLNIGRKEVRTCKICGSLQHDFGTCQGRGELPEQEQVP